MDSAHPPIRVLIAKVGLDGHDRGVKIVARTLRDAGKAILLQDTPPDPIVATVRRVVAARGAR